MGDTSLRVNNAVSAPPERPGADSDVSPKGSKARSGQLSSMSRPSITPRETKSSRLRKSLGSAGSPLSVTSAPKRSGSATPEVTSGGLAFETTRLRDELRAKQREADKQGQEITTLRSALVGKEHAMKAAAAAAEKMSERVLKAEGELANRSKELSVMTAERNRYRSEAADAGRQADKLAQRLAAGPKGCGFSDMIASLESELRSMKMAHEEVTQDNKGCYNLIRAKDRELDAAAVHLKQARAVMVENKELQNSILDLTRRLQDAADNRTTLLTVQRQLKAEVARAQCDAATAKGEAACKGRELASTQTLLKESQEREAKLADELAVLGAELVRVRPVAARATMREIGNGSKDEGIVPMTMHLEEVRYLRGLNTRLQEKLAHAERSAAASLAQKELLHKKLDALQAGHYKSPSKAGSEGRTHVIASCVH